MFILVSRGGGESAELLGHSGRGRRAMLADILQGACWAS